MNQELITAAFDLAAFLFGAGAMSYVEKTRRTSRDYRALVDQVERDRTNRQRREETMKKAEVVEARKAIPEHALRQKDWAYKELKTMSGYHRCIVAAHAKDPSTLEKEPIKGVEYRLDNGKTYSHMQWQALCAWVNSAPSESTPVHEGSAPVIVEDQDTFYDEARQD